MTRNHFWKLWDSPSFEDQVLKRSTTGRSEEKAPDIKEIIEPIEEEIILKKKKTATDIHMEIKNLINADDYFIAKKTLDKALKDGYTGKRIAKWIKFFKEREDKKMGSTTKNLWSGHFQDQEKKKKKKHKTKVNEQQKKNLKKRRVTK